MNKSTFQTMFSSTSGNIYKYTEEISEGQNPVAVITEQFIQDAGQDLMSVVVVEMSNYFVLYTDLTEIITSTKFEFLTDLVPSVVVVPSIIEPVLDVQPQ